MSFAEFVDISHSLCTLTHEQHSPFKSICHHAYTCMNTVMSTIRAVTFQVKSPWFKVDVSHKTSPKFLFLLDLLFVRGSARLIGQITYFLCLDLCVLSIYQYNSTKCCFWFIKWNNGKKNGKRSIFFCFFHINFSIFLSNKHSYKCIGQYMSNRSQYLLLI